MRFLVTGAAGFLGQRIVQRLRRHDVNVRCLVRNQESAAKLASFVGSDAVEFVYGSLNALPSGLARQCDVVIHAASSATGACAVLFANNVVGTRKLLAEIQGLPIKRFVHISSLAVYGTSSLAAGAVLDESVSIEPLPHLRDFYTFSKVAQEEVVRHTSETSGLPLVIVRPGVIYGPPRSPLTPRVGLQIGPTFVRMGGRQRLPYTYVDNCAEAIVLASLVEGLEGRSYNVVDDELPTGKDLLRGHKKIVGKLRVLGLPQFAVRRFAQMIEWYSTVSDGQLPAVLTRYRADAQWKSLRFQNSRAKTELGWAPATGLSEGLHATYLSLRDHKR
jgi:nucleoside-diphosphate-sugar epimerase